MFTLLLVFIVYNAYKTRRKRDLLWYCSLVGFCLFILGSAMGVLEHSLLGIGIGFIAVVLSIVRGAFSKVRYQDEVAKAIEKVDASELYGLESF